MNELIPAPDLPGCRDWFEVVCGTVGRLTEAERTAMGEMMRRVRAFLEGA